VAAKLRGEIGVEARLVEGRPGEFSVWVGEDKVAEKGWLLFPSARKVIDAVRAKAGA
jgi:hypothetical protein